MAPDKVDTTSYVDMGTYICVAIPNFGDNGTPCDLYPRTHKHYKKED